MLDAAPQLGWAMIAGMVGVGLAAILLSPRVKRSRRERRKRRLYADAPYMRRPVIRESVVQDIIEALDAHYPDTERRRLR